MRRVGTGNPQVEFVAGVAKDWVFGVSEAFRDQLDIRWTKIVDKKKSRMARERNPRNLDGSLPTVFCEEWRRGDPPILSFNVGHIFYDPPEVRLMRWADALPVLRRIVQITEARPDVEPGSGWVKAEIHYYDQQERVRLEVQVMSQAQFEIYLRTGALPAGCD